MSDLRWEDYVPGYAKLVGVPIAADDDCCHRLLCAVGKRYWDQIRHRKIKKLVYLVQTHKHASPTKNLKLRLSLSKVESKSERKKRTVDLNVCKLFYSYYWCYKTSDSEPYLKNLAAITCGMALEIHGNDDEAIFEYLRADSEAIYDLVEEIYGLAFMNRPQDSARLRMPKSQMETLLDLTHRETTLERPEDIPF